MVFVSYGEASKHYGISVSSIRKSITDNTECHCRNGFCGKFMKVEEINSEEKITMAS